MYSFVTTLSISNQVFGDGCTKYLSCIPNLLTEREKSITFAYISNLLAINLLAISCTDAIYQVFSF